MAQTVVQLGATVYRDRRSACSCTGNGLDQFNFGRRHSLDSSKANCRQREDTIAKHGVGAPYSYASICVAVPT